MTTESQQATVHLGLPKGRMHDNVIKLMSEAGISLKKSARGYRPDITLEGFEVKILKPQNIVTMLAAGTRDAGFAGADWVSELSAEIAGHDHELVELLDTKMDPVRIVVAAPRESVLDSRFPAPKDGRPLRVASELEQVSKQWIARTGLDARFVRTYGATEVFPPEDADMIIDVTQTGATLEANGLVIIDDVMTSATRLYASSRALDVPEKRRKLEELVVLLSSVLDARGRVLIDMNVAEDQLEALVKVLPCMREPTVSRLHAQRGYAVRVAAPQKDLPRLVPLIKQHGGSDIVVSQVQQVVP